MRFKLLLIGIVLILGGCKSESSNSKNDKEPEPLPEPYAGSCIYQVSYTEPKYTCVPNMSKLVCEDYYTPTRSVNGFTSWMSVECPVEDDRFE